MNNRLRQLAHYLRTQAPSNFNMAWCPVCALGVAAQIPEFRLLGVYDKYGLFRFGTSDSVIISAAEFFGTSVHDIETLFSGTFDIPKFGFLICSKDAKEVANMVDAIADKYNEPPLTSNCGGQNLAKTPEEGYAQI